MRPLGQADRLVHEEAHVHPILPQLVEPILGCLDLDDTWCLPDSPKPDSPKLGFRVRVSVSANRVSAKRVSANRD